MAFGYPSNRGYRVGKIPGTGVDSGGDGGTYEIPVRPPRRDLRDSAPARQNASPPASTDWSHARNRPAPYGRYESGLPRPGPGFQDLFRPPPAPQLPALYKPPGLPAIYLPPLSGAKNAVKMLRKAFPLGRVLDAIDLGMQLYQLGQPGGDEPPLPNGMGQCCGTTGPIACKSGAINCTNFNTMCATVPLDCQALPCTNASQTTTNFTALYYMKPDPDCPFQPRYILVGCAVGGTYNPARYIPGLSDIPDLPAVHRPTPRPPFPRWYPQVDPLVKRPNEPEGEPAPVPYPLIPEAPASSPDRNPDQSPTRRNQEWPTPETTTAPRPSTRGRTQVKPGEGVEYKPPFTSPPVKAPPAVRQPPGPRQKERKITPLSRIARMALRLVNVATEGADMVSCLYKGLPKNVRSQAFKKSGNRSPAFRKKLALLYQHWDDPNFDIGAAVEACAMQQLSDAAQAGLSRAVRQLPGQQYLGRFGIQGRTSRPTSAPLGFGSASDLTSSPFPTPF